MSDRNENFPDRTGTETECDNDRTISHNSPLPQNQEATTISHDDESRLKTKSQFLMGKDNWMWEIGSWILSAVCVVLMVVVLLNFQGTALSKWHMSIAPNTVISILATISKTSLLLPVAECISQLKWLHFDKARKLNDMDLYDSASRGPMGSLFFLWEVRINLGALGAIITVISLALDPFAQQLVSFPSRQAPMGENSASFRITQAYDSGAYHNPQNSIEGFTDFGMQGSIFSGLFDGLPPRAFECPTSNCTWSDTYSNLSLGVVGQCDNVTKSVDNSCQDFPNTRSTVCNITTPGGFQFNSLKLHQSAIFRFTCLNTTTHTTAPKLDTELTSFAVWRPLVIGDLENFEVIECRLSLAGYLYSDITVKQNILNIQKEVPIPLELVRTPNSKLNYFKPTSDQFPPGLYFKLLRQIFNAELIYPTGKEDGVVPDVLSKGNLSLITENIARGMTEHIRTGPNSTISNGVAYQNETYIHVKWPWVILPITVVAGAGVFLACSIGLNSRRKAALWKSSSVALLLHSVEGSAEDGFHSRDIPRAEMDALAEKMRVLRGDNMGFRRED
ncbi:DUF3176 domain-containing protein [Aspergillus glaucus CBS 516.65]|uniref:Uncharacterized protein n=1 Tax=Aspergillus glaucus CBS 516.65 TaxID=1160497 RepID=A0A1L9VSZ4_ASPGL|nr:hypothetical protein ASPGLDRAFT_1508667 [Aspergillus glaucus CBS 516.65]OJJ87025.1 hypothetical protein ASPGLDRAFT_1508667 [Aspergillus glaucus CBS 516.65]